MMRAIALAMCMLLAGCLSTTPAAPSGAAAELEPDWAERAIGVDDADHDHDDPSHHMGRSTPNFRVVGHDPLVLDGIGTTAGSHWCGDTKSDGDRSISITHSWRGDTALIVVDTTEPSVPRLLGELYLPWTQVYDVALTDDMRYAVLGTSIFEAGPDDRPIAPSDFPAHTPLAGPPTPATPMWRDACTGIARPIQAPAPLPGEVPYAAGIVLVDLTDLTAPAVADYLPLPAFGAHSVHVGTAGGQTLVAASVFGYFAYPLGYLAIASIDDTSPLGPRFALESVFVPPGLPPEPTSGSSTIHDAWVADHPVTGAPLIYAAYGSTGLFLLDVADPTTPLIIGSMTDWSGLGGINGDRVFAHAAYPLPTTWSDAAGERHYTFVGEECPAPRPDTPSCLIVILDTTDPAAPAYVGAWTLPVYTPTWQHDYQFSTHYFAVHDGTLFTSLYHGGVWAADVSTPAARAAPPTIGAFLPLLDTPAPGPRNPAGGAVLDTGLGTGDTRGRPFVLDLDIGADGTLVVYDSDTGLYAVAFDREDPAPAPTPVVPIPGG